MKTRFRSRGCTSLPDRGCSLMKACFRSRGCTSLPDRGCRLSCRCRGCTSLQDRGCRLSFRSRGSTPLQDRGCRLSFRSRGCTCLEDNFPTLPRAEQRNKQHCRRISLQPQQWQRGRGGAAERSLNRNGWELQHRAQRGDQKRRSGQAESTTTQPSPNCEAHVWLWDSGPSLGQPGGRRPYERKRKRWRWRQHYSGALQ